MPRAIRTGRRSHFILPALGYVSSAVVLFLPPAACRRGDGLAAPALAIADARLDQASAGQPMIGFDVKVHDFGLVNEGPPLKYMFLVKNKGTAPLVLSGTRTSCGCTTARLDVTTLAPAGSGSLSVTMDTHGERGQGERSITVSSNDPRQPTSTLAIRYDVEPLLSFERPYLHMSTSRGSRRVDKVWLTGDRSGQAKPRIVRLDHAEILSARILHTSEHGQLRKGLRLELNGKQSGSGEAAVVIQTGLPNPSELVLPIQYAVD